MNCRGTTIYKRLERTRHERASLVSCVGEPLKRWVSQAFREIGTYIEGSAA
jgi:hypothetical protein